MSKEARSFFKSVSSFCRLRIEKTHKIRYAFVAQKSGQRTRRLIGLSCLLIAILCGQGIADAANYRTANFSVHAANADFARQAGAAAERLRSELSLLWLGEELPQWARPCEINVRTSPELPSGGETVFTFSGGEVYDWKMRVQGSEERVLDSVLPHEITHTILASYLRAPAPRWLDEGMATSVESDVERVRYRTMLVDFLQTKRGIPFNDMISMKEYPDDLTPFYSQAFSICEYLILVGGQRRLIEFAREGYETNDWDSALKKYYECESLGYLQMEWIEWVRKWASNDRPINLPATRKLPDFDSTLGQETMLAHNERLSVPGMKNRNGQNELADVPNNEFGRGRILEGIRDGLVGLGRQDFDDRYDRTARGQSRDRRSEQGITPFNGLPMYGKTISSRDNMRTRNVDPGATLEQNGSSSATLDRSARSTAQRRNEVSDNSYYDAQTTNTQIKQENFLANGAGSATRNQTENGAAPIFYRPSQNSVYSDDIGANARRY